MANWASKRRFMYAIFFVSLFLLIGLWIGRSFLDEAPTCFDKKQNQQEEGIDCGGPCFDLCSSQLTNPTVLWSRIIKVSEGNYHFLAYVENLNEAVAYNVPYSFKAYDSRNILIYEKTGSTFIPTKKIFPVFEASVNTGERTPVKSFFDFKGNIKWIKITEQDPELTVRNENLSREDTSPRLDAVIENQSVKTANNIEVTAILFDINNNVAGVSKTIVDFIEKNSSKKVVFTWPVPFTSDVVRWDIIPVIRR